MYKLIFILFVSSSVLFEGVFFLWVSLVAGMTHSNFIKIRLQHRCFSVNVAKILSARVLKNIYERLRLK